MLPFGFLWFLPFRHHLAALTFFSLCFLFPKSPRCRVQRIDQGQCPPPVAMSWKDRRGLAESGNGVLVSDVSEADEKHSSHVDRTSSHRLWAPLLVRWGLPPDGFDKTT